MFTFNYFATEGGFDFLSLTPGGGSVVSFSGAAPSTQQTLALPQGTLAIVWTTDGSVVADGWQFTWSLVAPIHWHYQWGQQRLSLEGAHLVTDR